MSIAELGPAFSIGLLATLSPCVLPLYPGFLSYLAAQSGRLGKGTGARFLGACVLAGVLTMMLALGALIAALSLAVGQVLVFVTPLADTVVVGLGVLLLLGRNPFERLPQISSPRGGENPYLSAFVYGMLYGPIALPCSGALVVSIFSLSFTVSGFLDKLLFFLFFGLGFGLPLLGLSFTAQAGQRWLMRQFAEHHTLIGRLGGALLVVVGTWDFALNWPSVALYLGL